MQPIAGGAGDDAGTRSHDGRIVLVVDDHGDTRQMYVEFLAAMGLASVEATTCAEALAKASSTRVDAIVLDRRLPDGDGGQVCRTLKSQPSTRDIPIIVISGRERDESFGADTYLMKPVIPDTLFQELERLIARRGGTRA
jgi:CheY-like chemotaxis protein